MSKLVSGLSSLTGWERTVNTLQLCLSNVGTFRVASGFLPQKKKKKKGFSTKCPTVSAESEGDFRGSPNDSRDHASCLGGTLPLGEPLRSSQAWKHYGYNRE